LADQAFKGGAAREKEDPTSLQKTRQSMDLFENLRAVALQQSRDGEFPVWILADILQIASNPARYADQVHLVEILITQIGDYDPYAGAGCFGTSIGSGTIQATIHQIQNNVGGPDKRCELLACCQFFGDNMKNLPKAAEYIKNKLCLGDYESCNRFRIYKESGGANVQPYYDPVDAEEVKKALQCLQTKQNPGG
jgi:hypothetical protein